jgi:hypothetical protein
MFCCNIIVPSIIWEKIGVFFFSLHIVCHFSLLLNLEWACPTHIFLEQFCNLTNLAQVTAVGGLTEYSTENVIVYYSTVNMWTTVLYILEQFKHWNCRFEFQLRDGFMSIVLCIMMMRICKYQLSFKHLTMESYYTCKKPFVWNWTVHTTIVVPIRYTVK